MKPAQITLQLLKKDLINANVVIAELQAKVFDIEQKAVKCKKKYKEPKKKKSATTNDVEYQKLGNNTMIPKQKFSL